jgi:hypothetical protein
MITLYTLTYNESLLAQFVIDHYRERFPNCNIVIYDNYSTDNTIEICKKNDCKIIYYNSNNTLDDNLHRNIKNSCWKDAKTDWIIVSDFDELLDINEDQLKEEEKSGATIIKAEGWTMVNLEDNFDIQNIKHGYRSNDETAYDKCMLFNKKFINEMNYTVGCHQCYPVGHIKYGNRYKMFHYKFINPSFEVKKRKETLIRLIEQNRKYNMGLSHNSMTEEQIIADFNGRRTCGKIRD